MSYENLSVAYGTTDVGPDILAMKGAGTDIGRRSAETIEDLDCAIGVVGGWCCK